MYLPGTVTACLPAEFEDGTTDRLGTALRTFLWAPSHKSLMLWGLWVDSQVIPKERIRVEKEKGLGERLEEGRSFSSGVVRKPSDLHTWRGNALNIFPIWWHPAGVLHNILI